MPIKIMESMSEFTHDFESISIVAQILSCTFTSVKIIEFFGKKREYAAKKRDRYAFEAVGLIDEIKNIVDGMRSIYVEHPREYRSKGEIKQWIWRKYAKEMFRKIERLEFVLRKYSLLGRDYVFEAYISGFRFDLVKFKVFYEGYLEDISDGYDKNDRYLLDVIEEQRKDDKFKQTYEANVERLKKVLCEDVIR